MTLLDDIDNDLQNTFYDVNDGFAVEVTTSGDPVPGIFEDPYAGIDAGGFGSVQGSQPRLRVRDTDLTNLQKGSLCTIGGVSYRVGVHQSTSYGETILPLVKV